MKESKAVLSFNKMFQTLKKHLYAKSYKNNTTISKTFIEFQFNTNGINNYHLSMKDGSLIIKYHYQFYNYYGKISKFGYKFKISKTKDGNFKLQVFNCHDNGDWIFMFKTNEFNSLNVKNPTDKYAVIKKTIREVLSDYETIYRYELIYQCLIDCISVML